MDWSQALRFDGSIITGELIISFAVMILIIALAFVIYFRFRNLSPDKPQKGFNLIVFEAIRGLENFTVDNMGKKWKSFAGYVLGVALYIILCFIIGITGLPNPLVNLTFPLSLGLCTFVLIHFTAARANRLRYFKRYIDPIPVLLPINLLSMWAPLLSLSLRLFGNALAGYCLMSIVYYFTELLSAMIFSFIPSGANQIFLSWIIAPPLHMYFDLFSGAIQTMVFCILTMIWIAQEDPEDEIDELEAQANLLA